MNKIKIPALLLLSCTLAWGQVPENKPEETLPKSGMLQVTRIKSLGEPVNSPASELLPVLSPDGNRLYFSRESKETGVTTENIWVSDKTEEGWGEPTQLTAPFGTEGSHYVLQYLPAEGKKLPMLILGNNYSKGSRETPLMYSYSKDNGKTWGKPKEIKIQNIEGFVHRTVCFLTLDRQHLLLSMNYKDGFGGDDIFVCTATGEGKFGPPANIGDAVNSEADETSPFLSPDGNTLYFSSIGRSDSRGGLDIYVSSRLNQASWNEWSSPTNLAQINTPFDDADFSMTSDGMACFSRGVDKENVDLYQAGVNYISPNSMVTVKGKMLNKEKQPVAGRIAVERSSNGQWVNMVDNDPATGEYKMQVQGADKYEMYGIVGDSHSEKVNLDLSATASGELEAPVIYYSKEQAPASVSKGMNKTPIAAKAASNAKPGKPIAADFASASAADTNLDSLTPKEEKMAKPSPKTKTKKPTDAAPTDLASTAASETISEPAPKEKKVSLPAEGNKVASADKNDPSDKKEELLEEASPDAVGAPAPETIMAKTKKERKKERKEKRKSSRKKSEELQQEPSLAEEPPSPEEPVSRPAESVASSEVRKRTEFAAVSSSADVSKPIAETSAPTGSGNGENKTAENPAAVASANSVASSGTSGSFLPESSNKVLFEVNQAIVAPEYLETLDRVASELTGQPSRMVRLAGYADPSGPSDWNLDLSKRRAKAVARYLKKKGVSSSQIDLHYYGEKNAKGLSSSARRVEINFKEGNAGEGTTDAEMINFGFNRDIVGENYRALLDKVALQVQNGGVVQLSGYTDSIGPDNYNMSLSKRRAQAVAQALKKRGVPAEKIVTRYYGAENPIDPVRQRRNRRVEIRIN